MDELDTVPYVAGSVIMLFTVLYHGGRYMVRYCAKFNIAELPSVAEPFAWYITFHLP